MRPERPTRRRALAILAGTTAALAAPAPFRARSDLAWHGSAMGAEATIWFSGVDRISAETAAKLAVAEIERLELALSLFRDDSEINCLNRSGELVSPSGDLRRALALGLSVADLTGGLFDPTVQALWEAHVDWLTTASGLPPDKIISPVRALVDWRRVSVTDGLIRLGAGQRVTLNGLGQGYITDRVADLLRARGFDHVLVDLGEQRALGPRGDGAAWLIERSDAEPLRLADGALATSEGSGCVLGADGAAHHLFDPRTGRSAHHWRRMTVHHASAAVADAVSTALYAAGPDEIAPVLTRLPRATAWARDRLGRETVHHTPR